MAKQLLVESVRIDGKTQSRDRINSETVAEYAEAMSAPHQSKHGAGEAWPPVTVFFDGTEYWMADGFHRLLAAQRIGRKNIAADVKQGTREDAAWAACAANQTHGLRRTNADKRKAVQIALRLHPERSDGALAAHCGVSREFVLRVRRETKPQPVTGSQVEKRVGLDGRARSVPPRKPERGTRTAIGPLPRPEERRSSSNDGVPNRHPAAGDTTETGDKPGPVDEVGRRIPDSLLDLWVRRQEVQDILTALSRVRVALREAQDGRDPLFSEIPFSSALAHLDQAYDAVQVAKPYAVCAFCQGHGCKACGNRGLLGKFRWDTAVPREHKEAVARLVAGETAG